MAVIKHNLKSCFLNLCKSGVTVMATISKNKVKIGIVGLGYVGLPLAVAFGKIQKCVGFDINTQRISELRDGVDVTKECSKEELNSAESLYVTSFEDDLAECNRYIITVPTPIDNANKPDLKPLELASKTVGKFLKKSDIVIYESTVYPGATEEVCIPILEKTSGLKFNEDFFCGYSPERVNPGDKVNTLTTITKIVSGSTPEALSIIDNLYSEIITAGTWKASSIRVAEAAKVIENTQRDLNIAFVNELSVIFERLDIDTDEVLKAAGTKWNFLSFKPGMVGGHCIGVDPYYLTYKAEEIGYFPQIITAGRRLNNNMARYAARNIIKRMINNGIDVTKATVGIFGVTFKENCPDIRNSKIFDLISELESWGVKVIATDPWADKKIVSGEYNRDLLDSFPKSSINALVVAVSHNEYRDLSPSDLLPLFRDKSVPVLADLKSIYDQNECLRLGFTTFRF